MSKFKVIEESRFLKSYERDYWWRNYQFRNMYYPLSTRWMWWKFQNIYYMQRILGCYV